MVGYAQALSGNRAQAQAVLDELKSLSTERYVPPHNIAPGTDGTPGRPTLKRRPTTPDDSTTPPANTNDNKPADNAPPTLRRNDGTNPPPPPPPSSTP